jgi:hypothetical protein
MEHADDHSHEGEEGYPEPVMRGTTLADWHGVSPEEAEQALDTDQAGEPELPEEDPEFEEDGEEL